jgi:hypothetical protein
MTADQVEVWLTARRPERPGPLSAQMSRLLRSSDEAALEAAPTMAEALAVLGATVLAAVGGREPDGPALAMDLLAADAFVTYAFEAAAEEGASVEPLVQRLLREAA